MALIGKARPCCNLRQAGSSVTYQFCCALQSKKHDVTVRRYADRSGEHPTEMKWTASRYAGKGCDFDRFIQMSNDVVPDPSEHLFVQAASRRMFEFGSVVNTRHSRNLLAMPLQ
jgi:hypothetical protein